MAEAARQLAGAPAAAAIAATPIRVLVIDDSAVMRAILSRMIDGCDDLDLVGQAHSVAQAFAILGEKRVDIILLDLEMPEVDGLAALPDLLKRGRGARVLVVSSTCGAGADASVRALVLGAADTLQKPAGLAFAGAFRDQLLDGIRRLGRAPAPVDPSRRAHGAPIAAVGIAASTGGVHALGLLLEALPASFTAPLLVTQHLPAAFTPFFATQLAERSGRPVRVADTGMQPVAGEILLAPGFANLTLVRVGGQVQVRLEGERTASGCLPSADPMLATMAAVHGAGAAAVVLSGMGRDGADGARAVADAGGLVLVQDAATSVVWGMPGAVARRGLAQAVLPPAGRAACLAQRRLSGTGLWT